MIAVLMIPGPTNALLASSAHQQGIAKTSLLIPAEFFGYMYAISVWALFIHLSAPIWPYLIDILHVLSAGLCILDGFSFMEAVAFRTTLSKTLHHSPRQLFFSTFKNPKALLFACRYFSYRNLG